MAQLVKTTFLPSSFHRCSTIHISSNRARTTQLQDKIGEIFMPEGKIVSWVKSEGDKLSNGESVIVVESDKADMDVETFYDVYLAALLAETEEEIAEARSKASSSSAAEPGSTSISAPEPPQPEKIADPAGPAIPEAAAAVASAVHPATEGGKRVVASPYAKKLKVERVVVSGPTGRIVAKDVEGAAAASLASATANLGATVSPPPGIELGTVVPFTTMQEAVSRNMVESLAVPTFRVGYTITTDALDALYKKIKSKGVTMTALLAKATALALVKHPVVNSSCRDGNSFTYNSSINIAVAEDMDGGLITPVLQDADKADIYSLSRKWKELVGKAQAKQLQPHEYNTGTFTLYNLGMFGVDWFDAILPPGTGAIMAVGASQPSVVATKDGSTCLKNQMQVNVTADHRIICGADLASFLQTLANIIEDPKDLTL
ncbi:dihydrolipoyllysine-residue acetyltransferase component 5 of pyruvate dehydrogenase complex, chloroplastic isoform X2 [Manihot esculenta]|uniref:dihydrolipoyllysine-residue acetyltransferase component 5 of pyruvate dehydrogenase complex, chloroplastic isoform X2 n=1 Tax=Manihot esculenta TaxID=3983 RepID=UPI000B5D5BEA|nr:dihydrolipoyllysine-residue acetyltransferase component 5 of pyruvate dehydrogenase complex, chloroplastic isoform X2 [Manihot esculenta]